LATAINAIVNALAELGVRHIEMPATRERALPYFNNVTH
jgi:hypothetical protein